MQLAALCHHAKRSPEQDASFVIEVCPRPYAPLMQPFGKCMMRPDEISARAWTNERLASMLLKGLEAVLQDEKLAGSVEATFSCIAVLDGPEQNHQLAYADKGFEQLSGYARDELLGKPYLEVVVQSNPFAIENWIFLNHIEFALWIAGVC